MKLHFQRWHEAQYPESDRHPSYGKRSRFAFVYWLGIRVRIGNWHYVVTW